MSSNTNSPNNGNEWTNLIARKRGYSKELRELTEKVIGVDSTIGELGLNIKAEKIKIRDNINKLNFLKENIAIFNAELFEISEKIAQSKKFLTLVQNRLPKEDVETLRADMNRLKAELDNNDSKSHILRNETLERYRRTSMALEAIKAVTLVNEQTSTLRLHSKNLRDKIVMANEEVSRLESNIRQNNTAIDHIASSKSAIQEKRESLMVQYNEVLRHLESVNKRLDTMATTRRKLNIPIRCFSQPNSYDLMSEFKQSAQRKLKAGEKLTLDELRIVFEEDV
jgi:chromosome segregation ATPase